ncbi:MAG: hypothetical protein VX764_06640 [Planctomycetota bacterium]|nr:hypothetical protein [Planctomycetota bacterium]
MPRQPQPMASTQLAGRWTRALLPSLILPLMLGILLGASATGPGLGVPELPAETVSSGGGVHQALLPGGAAVTIDFTIGALHLGSGTGTGSYGVLGGYQAQREAIEERTAAGIPFRRGEANGDGIFDIADAAITFERVLLGGIVKCLDAADADDDGRVDIADGVWMLNYLFNEGEVLPAPGPQVCGPDPTADGLDCSEYDCP